MLAVQEQESASMTRLQKFAEIYRPVLRHITKDIFSVGMSEKCTTFNQIIFMHGLMTIYVM